MGLSCRTGWSYHHGDLAEVRRVGRIVAIQTSAALAAVLVLVGLVLAAAYVRSENRQIDDELTNVAAIADDVIDRRREWNWLSVTRQERCRPAAVEMSAYRSFPGGRLPPSTIRTAATAYWWPTGPTAEWPP